MPYSDDQVQSERKLYKVTGDQALKVLHWITWADSDYLAARKLLLDGLLVQGASLANNSIEKYLKATQTQLAFLPEQESHSRT